MKKVGKLKEEGNTLFKVGNYSSALLKYDEVYGMLSSFSDQVQGEQAYQSAVLLSNQSNCIFEQGLLQKVHCSCASLHNVIGGKDISFPRRKR